jgi:hypothetical protein
MASRYVHPYEDAALTARADLGAKLGAAQNQTKSVDVVRQQLTQ